MLSPGLRDTFEATGNDIALEALRHAHRVKAWSADSNRIELWKVDKTDETERALLEGSYSYLLTRFEDSGAFFTKDGSVTSEAQAYALLRAVWSDREDDFRRTWAWTKEHLRRRDGLLSWLWKDDLIVDANSATDADIDAALALLLAGERWNDDELVREGARMASAIWEQEVAYVGETPYVVAGNWAQNQDVLPINPSYFSPYAYQIGRAHV